MDDVAKLKARVAILQAELAGASGVVLAVAEHFEAECGLDDPLVQHLHARAADMRKWAGIKPSEAQ